MKRFYEFMHHLFWRTLCPRPDDWFNITLRGWPYNFTGGILPSPFVRTVP